MHESVRMIGVLGRTRFWSAFITEQRGDIVSGRVAVVPRTDLPGSAIEGYGFGTSATD